MLGKLIKHDFKALGRILWPTNIAVVAAGAVMAILMTVSLRFNANPNAAAGAKTVIAAMTGIPMVLIALGIMASMLLTLLVVCVHYYKNFMGDEGYLTFTLPVKSATLLWSKLLTGFFWMLINAAAIAIAVLLVLFFGTSTKGLIDPDLLTAISKLPIIGQRLNEYADAIGLTLLTLAAWLMSILSQVLKVFLAVTIGGMIAKNHKLLASIGMYFVVNIVSGVVKWVVRLAFGVGFFAMGATDALDGVSAAQSLLVYGIGSSLVFAALYFLISERILTKRLNLQ